MKMNYTFRQSRLYFIFYFLLLLLLFTSSYQDYEYNPDWQLELKREPYLQPEGENYVRVRWMCNKPMDDPQFLWHGEFFDVYQLDHRLGIMYEAVVPVPEIPEKIEYEIYNGEEPIGEMYHTNLLNLEEEVTHFFAVGDIGEATEQGIQHLLNGILEEKDSLQFGILLGDIIYEKGESELYDEQLFQPLSTTLSRVPVYPVLGNHDWKSNLDQNYFLEWHKIGNGHFYHFTKGNALFIVLDSKEGYFYRYNRQKDWLERTLKKYQGQYTWTIVALHHNGKSCTYKKDLPRVIKLYDLFAKYGVDLVMNGHAHTYERHNPMDKDAHPIVTEDIHHYSGQMPDHFISITTGAGGKLHEGWEPDDDCEHSKLVARSVHAGHVSTVRIEGNRMDFRVYTHNKEVADYFVWEK